MFFVSNAKHFSVFGSKLLNYCICFINLFVYLGDALGGHLDDMEADWSKPIVSMR